MAAITNEIYIGSLENPSYHFQNSEIVTVEGELGVSLIGETLSADTLTPTVLFEVKYPEVFKPTDYTGIKTAGGLILSGHYTSDISKLTWGTPVWFYNNGNYIGKFYISSVTRTGRDQWKLEATSFVGLLDRQQFYGRYYYGVTFSEAIKELIATNGVNSYCGYKKIKTFGKNYIFNLYGISGYFTMHQKFHYYGIGDGPSGTSGTAYLFGFCHETVWESYSYDFKYKISVEAELSRESESDAWNDTLDFYFHYQIESSTEQILGPVSVSPDSDIELDIVANSSGGTFTMNGQTFSFTTYSCGGNTYAFCINGSISTFVTVTDTGGVVTDEYLPGCLIVDTSEISFITYNYTMKTVWSASAIFGQHYTGGIPQELLSRDTGFYRFNIGSIDSTYEYELKDKIIDSAAYANVSDFVLEILDKIFYDKGIADALVYGWLPSGTKREALQQLLFAENVNLIKGEDDALLFTWIYDNTQPEEIPDADVYDDGSIEYITPAKSVSIKEHLYTYDSTADTETLYDNTDGTAVSEYAVVFDNAPIYYSGVTSSGLKILAINSNCAIVSGTGTLTGKPYKHEEGEIVKINPDVETGEEKTVSSAYLVTLANSENVLNRIYKYYTTRKKVKANIVLRDQKCGGYYSLKDKFGDTVKAFLTKMTVNSSAILKADCELIADYSPVGSGNNYTHSIILTGSGTWTVPSSVFEKSVPSIRVVLIGGGQGGSNGYAGEAGQTLGAWGDVSPAEGGSSGENGSGGKIYTVDIDEASLLLSYDYNCGTGGAGAPAGNTSHDTNSAGSLGTATTFGNMTSAQGVTNDDGVHNFFTGKILGKKPAVSALYNLKGGDCDYFSDNYYGYSNKSVNDYIAYYREYYETGKLPEKVPYYTNNHYPIDSRTTFNFYDGGWSELDSGFSGGSAAGEAGADGTDPYWASYGYAAQCGSGGKGGDALTPGMGAQELNKTNYGWGGYGGPGGGAGGHSGFQSQYNTTLQGKPGKGGYGGSGGKGGDGCVIIYY